MTGTSLNILGDPIAVLRIPRAGLDWVSQNDHVHWRVKHAQRTGWRDMTLIQCRIQEFPKNLPPAIVVPVFVFGSVRRRDRGNFTPTSKVIIDALCTGPKKDPASHGWGAWPDDDDRYLEERMPVLHAATGATPGVIIRVYPRS